MPILQTHFKKEFQFTIENVHGCDYNQLNKTYDKNLGNIFASVLVRSEVPIITRGVVYPS